MKFNANLVGLWTGICLGGSHAIWSILVALGWAQALLDWIFSLHFVLPIYTITEFQLSTALILTVLTFAVGYIIGYVSTVIWDRMIK